MLIHRDSLSETLNTLGDALAEGCEIPAKQRKTVARWIAARQGLSGAYADTFAGFETEQTRGIQLFTGERVASASARHILGEEACRALLRLDVPDRECRAALERAQEGLLRCLGRAAADPRNSNPGLYCCGKCTVGLWRHLVTGGLDRQEERLQKGLAHLRTVRDGEFGWRRFPFWYTFLVLTEVDHRTATVEIRHAAGALEAAVARPAKTAITRRRQDIAKQALGRI